MPLIITNNATSLLSSSITATQTTVSITNGDEGRFPTFVGPDEWFPITVTKSTGEREVMRCTARSGVNLTVVRGQESTTPLIFDAGQARVDVRLTAAAITELAVWDRIYSIPAGMSVGFKTASNRFVWDNTKTFGSGAEVATMDQAGTLVHQGNLHTTGAHYVTNIVYSAQYIQAAAHMLSNGYYLGGGLIMLAPTTAGVCYIRPNGNASAVGEFYVNTNGDIKVSGVLYGSSDLRAAGTSWSGQSFQSSSQNVVLAGTGAAGGVYLRPRGSGDGAGQAILDAAGNFSTTGQVQSNSGHFHTATTNCYVSSAPGGQIILRPNGQNSSVEQVVVNLNGDLVLPFGLYVGYGNTNGSGQASTDGILGGFGLREKLGYKGSYGANWMNLYHVSGVDTRIYADSTHVGTCPGPSDYRIKKDVERLPSTWEHVRALRPVSYFYNGFDNKHEVDDVERWGFIAHELQEALLPSAATGHKDHDITENGLQAPDPWALIATLTSALQEAMVRIEKLEARAA